MGEKTRKEGDVVCAMTKLFTGGSEGDLTFLWEWERCVWYYIPWGGGTEGTLLQDV